MKRQSIARHLLKSSDSEPELFSLHELKIQKHAAHVAEHHRHNYHSIIFFFNGTADHEIDFQLHHSDGPAVHFLHSNSVHLLKRSTDATGVVLMFNEAFTEADFIRNLPFGGTNAVVEVSDKDMQRFRPLLDEIALEYKRNDHNSFAVIRSLLAAVLTKLTRFTGKESAAKESSGSLLTNRFRELLEKHFQSLHGVEQYADILCVSSKHLIETVRHHTGLTPLKLIHNKLISEAKRHLCFTDMSVKEISDLLHFSDSGNFSKFFRKETGLSALEYRKRIR